ncbi:MAG: hypothetical protein ACLRVT_01510, partial [Oscillospiraceae bacterium]
MIQCSLCHSEFILNRSPKASLFDAWREVIISCLNEPGNFMPRRQRNTGRRLMKKPPSSFPEQLRSHCDSVHFQGKNIFRSFQALPVLQILTRQTGVCLHSTGAFAPTHLSKNSPHRNVIVRSSLYALGRYGAKPYN